MKNNIYNIANPNADAAIHESSTAAESANKGRKYRSLYEKQKLISENWNNFLINDPVKLYTSIFLVLFGVDIMVAWEMYRDVISYFLSTTPMWAVLLLGLVVNSIAAIVSHYLSKTRSVGIFNFEVWNTIQNEQKPYELAVRDVEKSKKKDILWFWITFIFLLLIVGVISFSRSILLIETGQAETDYNWFQKVLPIIIIIFEVITGIYLFFVVERFFLKRKLEANKKAFLNHLHQTNQYDKIVGRLIQSANDNGEHIDFQRNIVNALFRLRMRDLDDNYIDEVIINQAEFVVMNNTNNPVVNIQVTGFLDDGKMTSSVFTDYSGKAIILWQSKHDRINSVQIGENEVKGPFAMNQVHRICLSLSSEKTTTVLIN